MIADAGSFNRFYPKGLRFQPTDEELVDYYLIPKILHPHSAHHYIADIQDFSQLGPNDLFCLTQKTPYDKEGFFFWPPMKKNNRIVRKGKDGFWSETCRSVSVTAEDGGEEEVAKKRVFVFCTGVYPGTRTSWFIHQFEYTASLPCDQVLIIIVPCTSIDLEEPYVISNSSVLFPFPLKDRKEIFLCKIFEHKQKDRVTGKKRKAESNSGETPAKTRRAKKDDSFRKEKKKISSAEEAQLGNKDLPLDANKSMISGEVIPQSHHLPSKDNINGISNNMHEGGYPWNSKGLLQSYGSPSYIQNFGDNQQRHHLPSNSTINISTYGEMFEEISNNEDSRYNARSADGSPLCCHMPLALKDDTTNSEPLQQSHHLPSNCKGSAYEEIPSTHQSSTLQGSVDCTEGDSNYQLEAFDIAERLKLLESAPPMSSPDVQSCGFHPPTSDLGDDQQSHHLPSKSTINGSTYGEMLGEISNNEDSRYNARSADGSQLSCHTPLAVKDDTTNSELLQQSHHLPSNCKVSAYEEIPSTHQSSTLQGSVDCTEGDSNDKLEKLVCQGRELARSDSLVREYGVADGYYLPDTRAHVVCFSKNGADEKICHQSFPEDEQGGFHMTSGLQNNTSEYTEPEADCASTIDHEPDLSSASLSVLHERGVPTKGLENDHDRMREWGLYLVDLDQPAPSSMYQDMLGSQVGNIAPDKYNVHWNSDLGVFCALEQ